MSATTSRGNVRIRAAVDLPACDPEMLLLCFPPQPREGGTIAAARRGDIDRVACFQAESFLQVRFHKAGDSRRHRASERLAGGRQLPILRTALRALRSPDRRPLVIDHEGIVAVTVHRGALRSSGSAPTGPDPQDVLDRQEMLQHLQESMALWSQVGAVLEPNTIYRMKILTRAEAIGEGELARWTNNLEQEEIACFRTEGCSGLAALSVPVGHPSPDQFDSGLDDLARYEANGPGDGTFLGKKPLLPKPVYRAYDVGAEFNGDYVDLMPYRWARPRALSLRQQQYFPSEMPRVGLSFGRTVGPCRNDLVRCD